MKHIIFWITMSAVATFLVLGFIVEINRTTEENVPLLTATPSGGNDEDKITLHSIEDVKIVAIQSVKGISMAEVRVLKDEAEGRNINHLVFLQRKHAFVGETTTVVWLNFIETSGTKRIGIIP